MKEKFKKNAKAAKFTSIYRLIFIDPFIPILTHSSPFDAYNILWKIVVDYMFIHSNTQLIKISCPK